MCFARRLEVLDMSYATFDGWPTLLPLTLRELYLHGTKGFAFPAAWHLLNQTLEILAADVDGAAPEWLGSFHKARVMDFRCHNGNFTIAANFCPLSQLQTLRLMSCNVLGGLPACIGDLSQLEVVSALLSNKLLTVCSSSICRSR